MPAAADHLLACLGGLAHDLGKLWAQVPSRPAETSQFECESPRQHPSFARCPTCPARYRYAHAPLGARLLRDTLPAFAALQELVALHHGPGDLGPILRAVTLGDHLSAAERDERADAPADAAQPVPALRNPLAAAGADALIAPAALGSGIALAPAPADAAAARRAYEPLFSALREALKAAARYAAGDYARLPDHLLGAVYRGALTVPSAFQRDEADIALASHLHLAGAFAAALAHDGVDSLAAPRPVAGVVAGDISGIQDFVHDVANTQAARSLRARSFYLQVLALVVARAVARVCGLPAPAVVATAGGNFLVIVPASSLDRLAGLRARVDAALYRLHGTRLGLALAGLPATAADLGDFAALRRRLSEQLSLEKYHRFAGSADQLRLFDPRPAPSSGRACRACGREADAWVEDAEGRWCAFCASLRDVGRRLPTSRYLTLEDVDPCDGDGWTAAFAALGCRVRLEEHAPAAPFGGAIYALDDAALDALPCAQYLPVGRAVPLRRRDQRDPRSGAPPHRAGEPLTFAEIAAASKGRPTLAAAKLDVDDLGIAFQRHFGPRRRPTPSRVAAFGTFLALFFEGYLNEQAASPASPDLYMVYAGGDDLVAIGPYDQVLAFVAAARRDFARWTGNNPDLHLSAGISAGGITRPVLAALDAAEEALDRAKAFRRPDGPAKDAVDALGWTMPWEEFARVLAARDQLTGWLEAGRGDGAVARSLLRRLERLQEIDPGDGTVRYGPAVWRAYYELGRFAERHRALRADLERMYEDALRPGGGRRIALAAHLAEIATAAAGREAGGGEERAG